MSRKFEVGDLVEESGEGRGRFWRIAFVSDEAGFLILANGSGYSVGWKPFSKMTLATDALKGRIMELEAQLRGARNELRAIEKNPTGYTQPKKRKLVQE